MRQRLIPSRPGRREKEDLTMFNYVALVQHTNQRRPSRDGYQKWQRCGGEAWH